MPAKDKQKLRVSLNASEMGLLERAAGMAGCENVSAWAKEVLLNAACTQPVKEPDTAVSADEDKPAPSRPMCTCGATSSLNGECDSSCIMRF